jgi:hypothetical protein
VTEASNEASAEPDVERDQAQVDPDADEQYVGRVAGLDEGYAGETGAEARAAGAAEGNEPVEGSGMTGTADDSH